MKFVQLFRSELLARVLLEQMHNRRDNLPDSGDGAYLSQTEPCRYGWRLEGKSSRETYDSETDAWSALGAATAATPAAAAATG